MAEWYEIGAGEAGGSACSAGGCEPQIADGSILRGRIRAGQGVRIGSGCAIEGDVEIGRGTRIDHHTVVRGRVRLGANNWIYPFCTIGTGRSTRCISRTPWPTRPRIPRAERSA